MSAERVFDALAIPPEALVDRRLPKKLLIEQSSPTATDKRHIQDGIEELRWLAALKPNNIGVPEYRDPMREYLEIAILSIAMRPSAKVPRLTELIHRAIPYPVLLIGSQIDETIISLAHKRFSQNESGQTVIDGPVIFSPPLATSIQGSSSESELKFRKGLPLAAQPRIHLCAVYQGWIECVEAYQAAQFSGEFVQAPTPQAAADRRAALADFERIQREITSLRARAAKETQISRRVDLNLDIRRLEGELAKAAINL